MAKTEKKKIERSGRNLSIVTHPDPRLRQRSQELTLSELENPEFRQLLADMAETMRRQDGAGLAAPQIGRNARIFVMAREQATVICINPQITKRSWARATDEEGCLSVRNEQGVIIYGPVERHKKVSLAYWNERGEKKKMTASDLLARVIQHEIDHLDGVLFIDRIKDEDKDKLHALDEKKPE